jgi:hypothetical protein
MSGAELVQLRKHCAELQTTRAAVAVLSTLNEQVKALQEQVNAHFARRVRGRPRPIHRRTGAQ